MEKRCSNASKDFLESHFPLNMSLRPRPAIPLLVLDKQNSSSLLFFHFTKSVKERSSAQKSSLQQFWVLSQKARKKQLPCLSFGGAINTI